MLTRIYGKFVYECDACGDTLETDTKDFGEAREAMRLADWRVLQVSTDWVHTCAGCKQKEQRDARARRAGRIP